jgi:hypothetical protein
MSTTHAIPVSKIGGRYKFERADDGTFAIFGVPIFAQLEDWRFVKKGLASQPTVYDEAWLDGCLKNHQEAFNASFAGKQSQYLEPLHVQHTSSGKKQRAGGFIPTKVEKTLYLGKEIPILYADFHGIPKNTFEKIQQGHLPYVSAEPIPEERRIRGLALLDSDSPYLQFPPLTVDDAVDDSSSDFAACVGGDLVMFCFDGGFDLPTEIKEEKVAVENVETEFAAETPSKGGMDLGTKTSTKAGPSVDTARMKSLLVEMAGCLGLSVEGAMSMRDRPGPVDLADKPRALDGKHFYSMDPATSARIKSLEEFASQYRETQERERLVEWARSEFAQAGINYDETTSQETLEYAAQGEPILKVYVGERKRHHVPVPTRNPTMVPNKSLAKPAGFPEYVQKHQNSSPAAFEYARTAYAQWENLGEAAKAAVKREQWVENRMAEFARDLRHF